MSGGAVGYSESTAALALGLTGLAFFLAFVRLAVGPTLADRVVAIELCGSLAVGATAAYSILVDQPVLLDAAMIVALVSFVATVGFAWYLERRRDE